MRTHSIRRPSDNAQASYPGKYQNNNLAAYGAISTNDLQHLARASNTTNSRFARDHTGRPLASRHPPPRLNQFRYGTVAAVSKFYKRLFWLYINHEQTSAFSCSNCFSALPHRRVKLYQRRSIHTLAPRRFLSAGLLGP